MNRIKKNITVRFFSIEASTKFFEDFVSNYLANMINENSSRIFTLKNKKHLIKLSEDHNISDTKAYAVTVVKERNTWQTKATSDGQITGISLNQGIIGDPYYFYVVPSQAILLGFTSGPAASLKNVGNTMLVQFQNDRSDTIKLNLIPKEKEFSALKDLPENGSLNFKIKPSSFSDVSSDAPKLLRDLSSTPFIDGNTNQMVLDLAFTDDPDELLSRENIIEIVDYLSDHEGCKMLKVKWTNEDGKATHLDFVNAFFNHKTEITTRRTFIEESTSVEILSEALSAYAEDCLSK